jgi:hypothetical protein
MSIEDVVVTDDQIQYWTAEVLRLEAEFNRHRKAARECDSEADVYREKLEAVETLKRASAHTQGSKQE